MDSEQSGPTKLPWFLRLHWGWLVAAAILQTFLSAAYPRWLYYPVVDLMFWWSLVQAGWMCKADTQSSAIYWYGASLVLLVSPWNSIPGMGHQFLPVTEFVNIPTVADALLFAGFLLWISSNFVLRSDMLRYFNGFDSRRLRLGILQAFVWNVFYFQYHFNKMAKFDDTPPAPGVTPSVE
jgi:hypothetical protein